MQILKDGELRFFQWPRLGHDGRKLTCTPSVVTYADRNVHCGFVFGENVGLCRLASLESRKSARLAATGTEGRPSVVKTAKVHLPANEQNPITMQLNVKKKSAMVHLIFARSKNVLLAGPKLSADLIPPNPAVRLCIYCIVSLVGYARKPVKQPFDSLILPF